MRVDKAGVCPPGVSRSDGTWSGNGQQALGKCDVNVRYFWGVLRFSPLVSVTARLLDRDRGRLQHKDYLSNN